MSAFVFVLISFFSQSQEPHKPVAYENATIPEITVDGVTTHFPKSYIDARSAFRQMAKDLKKQKKAESGFYKVASKTDNDLTTDYVFIPGSDSKRLFIVTSGLHGPEGYTGHTLQMLFLHKILRSTTPPPYSILAIHAVNPYGFKYFTRTNENNVDLNRNFVTSSSDFKLVNAEYEKLKNLIEPRMTASGYLLARIGFYAQIGWVNLTKGRKTVLGSLRGQYSNAQGIFYGGQQIQPETKGVQNLIKNFAANTKAIYLADLHTGFGEKGHLHLFGSDEITELAQKQLQESIFEGFHIDSGHEKNFYSTTGDFNDWIRLQYPKKSVVAMTYEFGTLDSQTLRGSLRSLWIMVLDNQGRNHGYLSSDDEKKSLAEFELLFNPPSKEWQQQILSAGTSAFEKTLQKFETLPL